ncbi:hypothetical protein V6U90_17385 [Micromonospora sp. CPCC 206060]|uniref:hypothetical protein n=1 Tax=Micromonospora sp. CPCC 206060 TaxID=3122406 RepID=UPI002FF20751
MSPASRLPNRRVIYLAAIPIAVALVATAVFVVVSRGCGGLFSSRSTTDTGECVGLIEESDALAPELRKAAEQILRENERVAESPGRYVKVALLTPLSLAENSASAMSIDQVRYSLQGAMTALHRINRGQDFGDPSAMRVQLLLVNYGSRQEHREEIINEIVAETKSDEHPLVAVVGLGSSFSGTEATARELSERGIPMVTGVASADSLTARTAPTLYSVSPSNTDYALALRELLRGSLGLRSGIIVADQNEDPYVRTLRDAFEQILEPYVKFPLLRFQGGTVASPATPNVFNPVVTNICTAVNNRKTPLDMVFFAGRVADFRAFAGALEQRICRDDPLAVLVGATGFQEAQQYADVLERGNITVIYASSTDPPAWINGRNSPPDGFGPFHERYQQLGFDNASLADGYAIMYHDALVSAALAIRVATLGSPIPKPADVQGQVANLTGAYVVRAASGTLSFAEREDGRAAGKVVTYRQVGRNRAIHLPPDLPPYLTR